MRDITRWAERQRAQGLPICVCAQGTVDLPAPKVLLEKLLAGAAAQPGHHRYPPQVGAYALREAFRRYLIEEEGIATRLKVEDPGDPAGRGNQLLVCSGVNGGFIAILHHVKAAFGSDARCAVIDPSYLYHDLDVATVFGRGALHIGSQADFTLDRAAIEDAVLRQNVKALLVCNPANPHGLLLSAEEIAWLVELTGRTGALIAFDEVYAHIQEPGQTFCSPLHLFPELPRHVVVVRGWSKILGLQGDRIGCVIAHPDVLPQILRWHDIVFIGVNGVAQQAMAEYLEHHRPDFAAHIARLNQTVEENSRLITDALERVFGWRLLRTERTGRSTIYRLFRHTCATDQEAMLVALQRGLALSSGNSFFAPANDDPLAGGRQPNTGTVRLSLAMPTEAVREGCAQLLGGKLLF